MSFINWIASIIAKEVANQVVAFFKEESAKAQGISAITQEAKGLVGELDAAQTETERKAILRKLSSFSDAARLRLG